MRLSTTVLALALVAAGPGAALAATFTVNSTADAVDASPGDALGVTTASADPSLVAPLRPACELSGACSFPITAADGRSGTTTIIVTVSDGTRQSAAQSFRLTVGVAVAGAPVAPAAVASGSGVALIWSAPNAGTALRYAVAGGTTPGGSDRPVVVTADDATGIFIPSLPRGTYYFRVYGIGDLAIGPPSAEASVTVTSDGAPGVVTDLRAQLSGRDLATMDGPATGYVWRPASGTQTVSVTTVNVCGVSTPSGGITFSVQP